LKWPGGKRWAAPIIAKIIKDSLRGTYFEPFLGGGAVFFYLRPSRALLSDVNQELIETYQIVRRSPAAAVARIQQMPVTKREYYRMRESEPSEPLSRATRFLYLNRTAFGGIYRLNRDGRFNVPFGGGDRTPAPLWTEGLLERAARALLGVNLRVSDFERIVDQAGPGDVVYCDPTYTVAHDYNGFVRYNERNFSWADQMRLAEAAKRAAARGSTVVISNAHHETIRKLYGRCQALTLQRKSLVSAKPDARRSVMEYLFVVRSTR
jgi:DNA adenine methylase